jgi:hypothetical protein
MSFKKLLLFFAFIIMLSCHGISPTPDLTSALATYDRLILKTDADSIALLYTVDGDLGTKAHGRDSIRTFLLQFKDFKVLEQQSTIDSISAGQDTGFIAGHYHQKVIIPVKDSLNPSHSHDTVSLKGSFRSTWIQVPEYGWQIRKMETTQ